jgi:sulfotransferase
VENTGGKQVEQITHFVSGMPRAGSTLLMNILAQNPRFGVTATSGLYEIVRMIKTNWDRFSEFQAMPVNESLEAKIVVLRAVIQSYHSLLGKPVTFDKSRGWLADIEMLEDVFSCTPKILVCVRQLGDVLSSFEKKYRIAKRLGNVPQEATNVSGFQTVEARCNTLLGNNEIVGSSVNRVRDAVSRGCRERLHFVEFDRLTRHPKTVLKEIYEFLDEDVYEHDFTKVKQSTHEDDRVYGWGDLHTIRNSVAPVESDWEVVLKDISPVVKQMIQANNVYWRRD